MDNTDNTQVEMTQNDAQNKARGDKSPWIIIVVILLVVLGIGFYMFGNNGNGDEVQNGENKDAQTNVVVNDNTQTGGEVKKLDNGLIIEDVKIGDGDEAVSGKTVSVHYVGTLDDGTKFDSSRDRGAPFNFALGRGQVIKGWDIGVVGMKVGGVRKLTIPADLAYGDRDLGAIPPNSVLHFEVELLGVQ